MISIFHHMRIKSKTFMTLLLIALLASFMADGPLSVQAQGAAVLSPGFNSQFSGNHVGWTPVMGVWALAPGGTYWTAGLPNAVSSIKHTGNYANMIYQVRVRKASVCSTNCGDIGLMLRGNPLRLGTWKDWEPEYWFAYANSGHFHVLYWNGSGTYSVLKNWTFSSKIVRGGWNKLKVIAAGPLLGFYINDTLVWSGSNPALKIGQVGIGYFRNPDVGPMYVDWATLSVGSATAADLNLEVAPGTEVPGGTLHQSP